MGQVSASCAAVQSHVHWRGDVSVGVSILRERAELVDAESSLASVLV